MGVLRLGGHRVQEVLAVHCGGITYCGGSEFHVVCAFLILLVIWLVMVGLES